MLKNSKYLIATIAFGGLCLASANPASAATFGFNLIKNPGAEAGPGATDKPQVVKPPSWTVTKGNFTAVNYGATSNNNAFPLPNSPGPSSRGKNFFSGGPDAAFASAKQSYKFTGTSDLSAIDTGKVSLNLSGWFGGKDTEGDYGQLDTTFLDKNGNKIKNFTIGKVTAAERKNITGLLFRSTTGVVPKGTRAVDFTLSFTRLNGKYAEGFADNLSLVLTAPSKSLSSAGLTGVAPTATPEPASVAGLLAIGGMTVASLRKKQQLIK